MTLQLEEERLALVTSQSQPQLIQARTRRTATQTQLSVLLQVLEAEERAGNQMLAIANY